MTVNMNTKTITYLELMQKIADNDQPAYVRLNDSLYKWDGQDYMCGDKRLYSALMHRSMAAMCFVKIEYIDDLLTKSEKRYLETVLKPYKDRNVNVTKKFARTPDYELLVCSMNPLRTTATLRDFITFPVFITDTMYRGLKIGKVYSLEDLGLWQEQENKQ